MTRREQMEKRLRRWGMPVTIQPKGGGKTECYALLQPSALRRIPDADTMGVVGSNLEAEGILYLGPASCRLDQFTYGTTVTDALGKTYRVVRARCVQAKGVPLYVQALLQEIAK